MLYAIELFSADLLKSNCVTEMSKRQNCVATYFLRRLSGVQMKGSKFEVVCMRQKKNKNANKISVTKNSSKNCDEVVKNQRVTAIALTLEHPTGVNSTPTT